MYRLKGIAALLLFVSAPVAMALEEPQYTVLDSTDHYEVREYEPYIVAEVDIDGGMGSAGRQATSG